MEGAGLLREALMAKFWRETRGQRAPAMKMSTDQIHDELHDLLLAQQERDHGPNIVENAKGVVSSDDV
jgi:hypothetical protein